MEIHTVGKANTTINDKNAIHVGMLVKPLFDVLVKIL
jgi:hypothetical protein